MSQNDLILKHLKRGPLTPLQALKLYGCFRLAARVYDLKGDGHDIRTRTVVSSDGTRYAQYWIKRR